MKLIPQSVGAALLLASSALSAPVEKRAPTDVDILQYALTLEHLENVFYKKGVTTFTEADFVAANFTAAYYQNLLYIVTDEEQHVKLLSSSLSQAGAKPVAACTYDFPFKDPKSFVTLASVLEGVGTTAYLGAAGLIQEKEYLGVAGAILVTEALHTSIQRFNLGEIAPANPYGTSLGLNDVYTLATPFIVSCPASNPPLPLKAFPALNATQASPAAPGMPFTFATAQHLPHEFYVTFVAGFNITSVSPTVAGGSITATVPSTVSGQSYVFLTSKSTNVTVTDDIVLAGPVGIEVTPPPPVFDISFQK